MVTGTAISAITLPEATGGEGAFTYALAPEVPGLTFDPDTRQLSGTPTVAGSYSLSYTATDAAGATATLRFSVTIRPTLWGTWRTTEGWEHDGEIVGTVVETLTFTASRFIMQRSHYRTDGSFDHSWPNSGTWAATDDTITRTWYHDHDDDEETPEVLTSTDKAYAISDEARNTLFVHYWDTTDVLTDFVRYDRVLNVSPDAVVGVWKDYDMEDDTVIRTRTISVNADGTFSYLLDGVDGLFEVTAQWQLDEAEYFLNLTDERATFAPTGEAPEHLDEFARAGRFAFAPTDEWPDRMVVSGFWHESEGFDEYREFGNYWMDQRRQ